MCMQRQREDLAACRRSVVGQDVVGSCCGVFCPLICQVGTADSGCRERRSCILRGAATCFRGLPPMRSCLRCEAATCMRAARITIILRRNTHNTQPNKKSARRAGPKRSFHTCRARAYERTSEQMRCIFQSHVSMRPTRTQATLPFRTPSFKSHVLAVAQALSANLLVTIHKLQLVALQLYHKVEMI